MKKRILFVDDEPNVLNGFRRMLHKQQEVWEMSFVCSVDDALDQLSEASFDVIVSDVRMPEKDGFELLKVLHRSEITKNIPVIIVTGCSEHDLKRQALDQGAMDLLNKPVDREELVARLCSMLKLKSYQDELKNHNKILEQRVKERTIELANSRMDIIWRLGKVAEYRDEDTGNHIMRVGWYCRTIAEVLGKGQDYVEMLFLTSPLHDIGKVGIPDEILLKRGKLSPEEWEVMKRHCVMGQEIFNQDSKAMSSFFALCDDRLHQGYERGTNPLLKMAATISVTHHERWDGTGYPKGLAGEDIPLEARIVALSDVYDALCSARPYKSAYPESKVIEIMKGEVGRHFEPHTYKAFEESLEEFRKIRVRFADGDNETTRFSPQRKMTVAKG
jgi:putative two-component system response regulator